MADLTKFSGIWSVVMVVSAFILLVFTFMNVVLFESIESKPIKTNLVTQTNLRGKEKSISTNSASHLMSMSTAAFPKLLYGTAWKKERTTSLVIDAIHAGFRGIDTACQPKHYNEAGVGEALKTLFTENKIKREELFIQTKFTSVDGQDPDNIPYDPNASLEEQVKQSFEKSCQNLGVTYLDSLVLHSPMKKFEDTMKVCNV